MASFLSHFNPVPTFPAYTGPYNVGTQEVEIPVSELSSPSPAPDPNITTISFRIFYPCLPPKTSKPVCWLPTPQAQYFRAYARFLNASHRLAAFLSYLPLFRTIFYTTIPAVRDAKIAVPPDGVERWPVMIFSHGLGGSRNAYSHVTGSVASHGVVVVAAEHRDGSAPISYIRSSDKSAPKVIDYRSMPHKPSPEVEESRNEQLKIRLWELGLIYDALLKMDEGERTTNIAESHHNVANVHAFESLLNVHLPGKISWAGHSFGASTVIQFVKSVYYNSPPTNVTGYRSIYTPSEDSSIVRQITPSSSVTLLDLWTLPLHLSSTSWLLTKPLPAYENSAGSPPLAILSEAFFKWKSNLNDTRDAISPPTENSAGIKPHIFYPIASAHLSQSDFGPLFPWLTRKIFKCEDPERTLRLNVRAILESLRRSGIRVADTSAADMESTASEVPGPMELEDKQRFPLSQDHKILATNGSIKGWVAVPSNEPKSSMDANCHVNGHTIQAGNPGQAVMEGEVMKQ